MALNIGRELAALKRLTVRELRARYAEVFGEATTSRHKDFLIRRILWRLQANEEGGLSDRARERARELAADSDVRLTAPRAPAATPGPERIAEIQVAPDDRLPMPGAVLTRRYKGRSVEVRVLPHGFEYEGEVYRSLTAVAKKVTGTHWNGYHFFRIAQKGNGEWPRSALTPRPPSGAPSTPGRAPRRGWSRSSTASTPSGRPARPTSRASAARAGPASPTATTTAATPAGTWSARP